MSRLPTFFINAGGAVASYDWIDYTSQVGYKSYYPCASEISGSVLYFITPKVVESTPICTSGAIVNDTNYMQSLDKDFDLLFNSPAIVKGDAFVNYTLRYDSGGAGYVFSIVRLYHVRGATETLLGSAFSPERVFENAELSRECIKITLTQTEFVIGDKLRVTIELWGKKSATNFYEAIYHDPSSRVTGTDHFYTGTIGTDLNVQIPFKINI